MGRGEKKEKNKKVKVELKETNGNLACGDGQMRNGKGNKNDEC